MHQQQYDNVVLLSQQTKFNHYQTPRGEQRNSGPSNREIAGRTDSYRKRFEWHPARYEDGAIMLWGFGVLGAGLVTALGTIGASSYTTHIYWTTHSACIPGVGTALTESMPGTVFGLSVAAFVGTALIQMVTALIRTKLNAKHFDDTGKKGYFVASLLETAGYFAAAGALALGYFCAQSALGTAAMTWELAAITGAITGAIIAIPSILLGPCKLTQGTLPHGADILASAVAGAVALAAAHYLTEQYFLHVLGTTAVDSALMAVMQIAVAMPIFAGVKMLFSMGYEGVLTAMARAGVDVSPSVTVVHVGNHGHGHGGHHHHHHGGQQPHSYHSQQQFPQYNATNTGGYPTAYGAPQPAMYQPVTYVQQPGVVQQQQYQLQPNYVPADVMQYAQ